MTVVNVTVTCPRQKTDFARIGYTFSLASKKGGLPDGKIPSAQVLAFS